MEDVREYLHLYLGQEVQYYNSYVEEITKTIITPRFLMSSHKLIEVKPILRRLDSMTEGERILFQQMFTELLIKDKPTYEIEAFRTKWLLSKGFWIFGDDAFDKGLIIDKDKM